MLDKRQIYKRFVCAGEPKMSRSRDAEAFLEGEADETGEEKKNGTDICGTTPWPFKRGLDRQVKLVPVPVCSRQVPVIAAIAFV